MGVLSNLLEGRSPQLLKTTVHMSIQVHMQVALPSSPGFTW